MWFDRSGPYGPVLIWSQGFFRTQPSRRLDGANQVLDHTGVIGSMTSIDHINEDGATRTVDLSALIGPVLGWSQCGHRTQRGRRLQRDGTNQNGATPGIDHTEPLRPVRYWSHHRFRSH
jgi:hypothetical protein